MMWLERVFDVVKVQVYILAILFCPTSCLQQPSRHTNVIALQPYAGFDQILLDSLSTNIANHYDARVVVLQPIALPEEAFVNIKSARFRADKLIQILEQTKPDTIDYILGLTTKDISTTKRDSWGNVKEPASKYEDWGVFGLGYMPGASCIVSTFRIGNPKSKRNERFMKICIHELGHNMGLEHCETQGCVMADAAETIKTIDQVHTDLCSACRKKLN